MTATGSDGPPANEAAERFVPTDFAPPAGLDHPAFRLRPLGAEHNERDHAAWTSSIDHIRATPGYPDGGWPAPMSLEENLGDLQRHHEDLQNRVGFTYTVLDPRGSLDEAEVIGCVYLYPDDRPGSVVHVRSWVRADRAELDGTLATAVRAWLEDSWPWRPEEIRDHPRPTTG
jgi:hypothetical protein